MAATVGKRTNRRPVYETLRRKVPTLELRRARARRLGLCEAASLAGFADQHVEIFTAVVDGDIPRARSRMRTHLRAVFEDVEKIRVRSPELFASDSAAVPVRRNVMVWE